MLKAAVAEDAIQRYSLMAVAIKGHSVRNMIAEESTYQKYRDLLLQLEKQERRIAAILEVVSRLVLADKGTRTALLYKLQVHFMDKQEKLQERINKGREYLAAHEPEPVLNKLELETAIYVVGAMVEDTMKFFGQEPEASQVYQLATMLIGEYGRSMNATELAWVLNEGKLGKLGVTYGKLTLPGIAAWMQAYQKQRQNEYMNANLDKHAQYQGERQGPSTVNQLIKRK